MKVMTKTTVAATMTTMKTETTAPAPKTAALTGASMAATAILAARIALASSAKLCVNQAARAVPGVCCMMYLIAAVLMAFSGFDCI